VPQTGFVIVDEHHFSARNNLVQEHVYRFVLVIIRQFMQQEIRV
jgi:hypothetical protein